MADVTALRYADIGDQGDVEERDTLLAVEATGPDDIRPIDLIANPRTSDAVTYSLSADEAWALARNLARAATEAESL